MDGYIFVVNRPMTLKHPDDSSATNNKIEKRQTSVNHRLESACLDALSEP